MIYTIGIKENYDKYIEEFSNPPAAKEIGGSVWETFDKVKLYLKATNQAGYGIYGVDADWDKDTKINKDSSKSWRDLTKRAKIVKI